MMKQRSLILTTLMLSIISGNAYAADFAAIGKIPVLFNVVILAGALACLAAAIKLFALVKGGALAKGWQLWVVSFVALICAQIFVLAEKLDVFAVGFDIPGLMYLATVTLWFIGLLQTRKVLG